MPIIDRQRRLHETGRIRIGAQVQGQRQDGSTYTRPDKLETFRLTSPNEEAMKLAAKAYGGDLHEWPDAPVGKQWELLTESRQLRILLPPEALSFSQWYEHWSGGGCLRRCDGETNTIIDGPCLCDPDGPEGRLCKPHTRLSVMLTDLPGAGLWRLDTQGNNAAAELGGAFELAQLIQQASGRALLPGTLRLDQRQSKRPDPRNADKTIVHKFAVPVVDFDLDLQALVGGTPQGLTPVAALPAGAPRTLADELDAANADVERSTRSNAALPVRPTGLAPRPRGQVADDGLPAEQEFMVDGPGDSVNNGVDAATLATQQQLDELKASIELLEGADVTTFVAKWKEKGLPAISSGNLTAQMAATGARIIDDIINAVADDPGAVPPVVGTVVPAEGRVVDTEPWSRDRALNTGLPPFDESNETKPAGKPAADAKPPRMIAQTTVGTIFGKCRRLDVVPVLTEVDGVEVKDNAPLHQFIGPLVGREVHSLNELTQAEGKKVIDKLDAMLEQQ